MNRKNNDIIVRENLKQYIKGGGLILDYRMSEEFSNKAEEVVGKSMFESKLQKLKDVLKKLDIKNTDAIKNTCLNEDESNKVNAKIAELKSLAEKVDLKKQTVAVLKDKALESFDIACASNCVKDLKDLDMINADLQKQMEKLNFMVSSSNADYEKQLLELKTNFDNFNFYDCIPDFGEGYSENAINDYKKIKANAMIDAFFTELSPQEKHDVLYNNEDIKRCYQNVGENI